MSLSRLLCAALFAALFVTLASPLHAEVCPLEGAEDAGLQRQLQNVLDELGLAETIDEGRLAVSLLVLTDPEHPRLAQVNGHRMIYAASLPKIAILLGAAVELDEGRLDLDTELEQDIQDMIRVSCNACATRVLDRVGRERLLEILQSPRYAFFDADDNGGLWVGKPYGPSPAYQRDPVANLSHGATTFQAARFYCALARGELVGPESTRLMRSALSNPGIDHKFVAWLSGLEGLELYRKSGSWKGYHADSVLVETGEATYILVALTNDPRGVTWLEAMAEPLHRLAVSVE